MLMTKLQMLNHLIIKSRNAPERPANERDAGQPPEQTLNVGVTILLKYLSNF